MNNKQFATSICTIFLLALPVKLVYADEGNKISQDEVLLEYLRGRWQGSIDGSIRDQLVSWRFVVTPAGELRGYMGPRVEGMPQIPMEDLNVSPTQLQFTIPSQHASFRGRFENDAVVGTWHQGIPAALTMRKKEFVFSVPPPMREEVVGTWEASVVGTRVVVSIKAMPDKNVSGTLSIPSRDIIDVPLVDIYSDDDLLVFYTDNNRSFSGNIAAKQMQGDYRVGIINYNVTFTNITQIANTHAFDLSPAAKTALQGRWTGFAGVVFQFVVNDSGDIGGAIGIDDRYWPVVDIEISENNVEITTENNRRFVGRLENGNLIGRYHYEGAVASVTFHQ